LENVTRSKTLVKTLAVDAFITAARNKFNCGCLNGIKDDADITLDLSSELSIWIPESSLQEGKEVPNRRKGKCTVLELITSRGLGVVPKKTEDVTHVQLLRRKVVTVCTEFDLDGHFPKIILLAVGW